MASTAAPSALALSRLQLEDLHRHSAVVFAVSVGKPPRENSLPCLASTKALSVYPPVLHCGRSDNTRSVVVAALAAETEVAKTESDLQEGGGGGGGVAIVVPPKPKKGKAALLNEHISHVRAKFELSKTGLSAANK